jgi:VWFA-related protein
MFTGAGFAFQLLTEQPKINIRPNTKGPRNELRSSTALRPNLRLDVKMILVPVTVTDTLDRPVMGLHANSFRVFENGVEQKVVSLSREEGPVSVGFIFDGSTSMKMRIDRSRAAIQEFLKNAGPDDEYFAVKFDDKPTLLTPFTSNTADIVADLSTVQPQGWTAMLDAICLGAQEMKHAKNSRRALVVLTDGGDNNSRYTESEVRNIIRESDLRVYAIGLFERPHFLEKLAKETGGMSFFAHKLSDLPAIVERLTDEFRNQYVLGYSSNNAQNDGKYRRVKVQLMQSADNERLNLFWRQGYYAPPD